MKASQADKIKQLERDVSDLGKWVAESVLRIEALTKALTPESRTHFDKHLSELKQRGALLRAKKTSQSLLKALEEFEGPKQ